MCTITTTTNPEGAPPTMSFPYSNQRIGMPVTYLSSSSHTAAGCALHFFQITEKNKKVGSTGRPSKRMLCLVDRQSFLAEIDAAVSRIVMISKIETMYLFEEDIRALSGPLTPYDVQLQGSVLTDFIRMIGGVFKPNDPSAPVPMYELEENQPIAARVNVRSSAAALEDTYAKKQGDDVIRRLRETNSREVASLKEALQRQRDEQLHELVDLQTQNEQLKHTLAQTENLLIEFKRQAKEQRMPFGFSEHDGGLASRRLGSPQRVGLPSYAEVPSPASQYTHQQGPPQPPSRIDRSLRYSALGSPAGMRPSSPHARSPGGPTRSPGAINPAMTSPRY